MSNGRGRICSWDYAKIDEIGQCCFNEGLYDATKILFLNISNFGRAASAMLKLQQYGAAVEAARKANVFQTWKEVHCAWPRPSDVSFFIRDIDLHPDLHPTSFSFLHIKKYLLPQLPSEMIYRKHTCG